MATIDFAAVVPKFDAILTRGLCAGVGERDGQMCDGVEVKTQVTMRRVV